MTKNDFRRLKPGRYVRFRKNLQQSPYSDENQFLTADFLKGKYFTVIRTLNRNRNRDLIELEEYRGYGFTRDMFDNNFKFGRENISYSGNLESERPAHYIQPFILMTKSWLGHTRYYINDDTRIEEGYHFTNLGYSSILQRRTGFGWSKISWTYQSVKTGALLSEIYQTLLWRESLR